jgi:hypothetical protein
VTTHPHTEPVDGCWQCATDDTPAPRRPVDVEPPPPPAGPGSTPAHREAAMRHIRAVLADIRRRHQEQP